ncbi:MAG: hypothetical protein U9P12_10200, partial [Verrucomicrobiota bacterium]|nr:hypothetical protein [Verrucomicrobiota bacterium]
ATLCSSAMLSSISSSSRFFPMAEDQIRKVGGFVSSSLLGFEKTTIPHSIIGVSGACAFPEVG